MDFRMLDPRLTLWEWVESKLAQIQEDRELDRILQFARLDGDNVETLALKLRKSALCILNQEYAMEFLDLALAHYQFESAVMVTNEILHALANDLHLRSLPMTALDFVTDGSVH